MKDSQDIDLKAIAWAAMENYGFTPAFPPSVLREVNALGTAAFTDGGEGACNLRHLLWSSIDNHDSQDLDQMEVCEEGGDGEILVRVAIADVDACVPKDSKTDQHAAYNGTSVYTGVTTFPMLPPRLSEGISSLLPGSDHRAVVIEYAVAPDGSVRHGGIYRAVVANKAKLVYEEVGDWLEGTGPAPEAVRDIPGLAEQILLQHTAALRLKVRRTGQGALALETIEAEPLVEDGRVTGLVVHRQNPAHCLIEEFMVAANGALVACLRECDRPMIQRVVRTPKNWEGIVTEAAEHGEALPAKPDAAALTRFLIRQKQIDPERFPDLSLTVVKLMGAGEYVAFTPGTTPIGHFALAVSDYTHGTAPNRRYVDVVIQRLVKSVLDGEASPYTPEDLEDLAAWLTGREKASQKVERFVRKAAAAVLLRDRIGETFEAFVTGASEKGTYVRLIAPAAEGRVMRGEAGLRVGQKVRVRLLDTDPYKGFIDFERLR
ncbi:RNB domain-containing ribonuclease [Methanoculleus sp. FWC-SCC1]|uniref:RNB domain-containing ribonuclease n=1 Tax=Methanoculleus frigidifontis TaxID=2584085 RepID=A0ABT8MDP4_9EURY|nr:RNB domain-containing ribonuclease [Methanoculleus sp. FWC-SCC1]MDN7026057.1 RNB domain-containing ribonuclease [Methanoculleus sp. FWC-SCC1]